MLKAIGYVRVSTTEQAIEGVSLAAQEAKIRAYADLYGLELTEIVVDAGQSAKTLQRPGLQRALGMLKSGDAEAIVIAKLDRLTRNVADWGTLIDEYFGKQWALLSVSDQIDTRTAAGRLVLNVLISVAQWEREAIAERTTASLAHKKAIGEHIGSVPYGFRLVGSRLEKEDVESQVVGRIQSLRTEGKTLQAIADELNAECVPTQRGGMWHASTVRNVINRGAA